MFIEEGTDSGSVDLACDDVVSEECIITSAVDGEVPVTVKVSTAVVLRVRCVWQ